MWTLFQVSKPKTILRTRCVVLSGRQLSTYSSDYIVSFHRLLKEEEKNCRKDQRLLFHAKLQHLHSCLPLCINLVIQIVLGVGTCKHSFSSFCQPIAAPPSLLPLLTDLWVACVPPSVSHMHCVWTLHNGLGPWTNCLCKSIKMTKQVSLYLLTLLKKKNKIEDIAIKWW